MLLDDLRAQLITAMKSYDGVTVETVRFLLAAVGNFAISKYGAEGETKVTDADVLEVVKKQVKTHGESIDVFTKAGRTDLADKEQAQLRVLEQYLPKQISDEELQKLLEPLTQAGGDLPAGEAGFGPMMGRAMAAVKGMADGGRVSAILKQLLSSK